MFKWKPEVKQELIHEIQTYFSKERDEDIGVIAAESMLTFINEKLAPYYFNAGVDQALQLCGQVSARLEEDLFSLKRPTK